MRDLHRRTIHIGLRTGARYPVPSLARSAPVREKTGPGGTAKASGPDGRESEAGDRVPITFHTASTDLAPEVRKVKSLKRFDRLRPKPKEQAPMSTDTDATHNTRTEYIAGLRALADLLEANPHLRLPMAGGESTLNVYPRSKKELADWVRVMRGKKDKSTDDNYMTVAGTVGALSIKLRAWRDEVCERVVVDTREVTERVPDPVRLAKVPKVTVTRTEEIVEWRCTPILEEAMA